MKKQTKLSQITAPEYSFQEGDLVTFSGKYKKRTFWQWLLRKPKELEVFVVMK